MANKMLFSLSLCRKAGALVTGFDAVQEAVLRQKTQLVLLAKDASDGTQKRIRRACDEAGVPTELLTLTQQQLSEVTKKPVAVLCVADENLARLCRATLEQEKNTEERP